MTAIFFLSRHCKSRWITMLVNSESRLAQYGQMFLDGEGPKTQARTDLKPDLPHPSSFSFQALGENLDDIISVTWDKDVWLNIISVLLIVDDWSHPTAPWTQERVDFWGTSESRSLNLFPSINSAWNQTETKENNYWSIMHPPHLIPYDEQYHDWWFWKLLRVQAGHNGCSIIILRLSTVTSTCDKWHLSVTTRLEYQLKRI